MSEVEVDLSDGGRAIVEGKTSVPFRTFVSLILQRKVQSVFKKSQDDPVIVSSELLTALASAPDDKQEDRGKLVLVTLGVGVLVGVFLSTVALMLLMSANIVPTFTDYGIVVGIMVCLALLVGILQRMQLGSTKQKIYEGMEKVTDLLSK